MTYPFTPNADTPAEVVDILQRLKSVIDPEAGISIVDMGLIYDIQRVDDGVAILMTMTSAACPMGDLLIEEIHQCLRPSYPPPARIDVALTFDPPWTPDLMSASAREDFGW